MGGKCQKWLPLIIVALVHFQAGPHVIRVCLVLSGMPQNNLFPSVLAFHPPEKNNKNTPGFGLCFEVMMGQSGWLTKNTLPCMQS